MRLIFAFFFLAAFAPGALAQVQAGPAPAGRVISAEGDVSAASAAGESRALRTGDPVFAGETLTAGKDGFLAVQLADKSSLSIAADSSLVIDTFVFDPATAKGQSVATVLRGLFKMVSGELVKSDPDSVKIKLPAGSIGVRGTTVAGRTENSRTLVILLGTLDPETGELKSGYVSVQNEVDGDIVESVITEIGHGVRIDGPDLPPSATFEVPPEDVQVFETALKAPGQGRPAAEARAGGSSVFEKYMREQDERGVRYRAVSEARQNAEGAQEGQVLVLDSPGPDKDAQVTTGFSENE